MGGGGGVAEEEGGRREEGGWGEVAVVADSVRLSQSLGRKGRE